MKLSKIAGTTVAAIAIASSMIHAPAALSLELSKEGNTCTFTSTEEDRQRVNLIAAEKYKALATHFKEELPEHRENIDLALELLANSDGELLTEDESVRFYELTDPLFESTGSHYVNTHLFFINSAKPDGLLVEQILETEVADRDQIASRILDLEEYPPLTYEQHLATLELYPDEIGERPWMATFLFHQEHLFHEYDLGNIEVYEECVGGVVNPTNPQPTPEPGPRPQSGSNGSPSLSSRA